MHTKVKLFAGVAIALAAIVGATGCSGSSQGTTGASGGAATGKVALLLKENTTPRWEAFDHPLFEKDLASLCPKCELLYNNAAGDSATQQSQAEAALSNGAKVLVVAPVDSTAAATIANMAQARGVPVIAYDALILKAKIDYYVSFQNEKVGELQAESLIKKLDADGKSDGKIVMINGSPTDANAGQFKSGALKVLKASSLTIAKSYDTQNWDPANAQTEMEQAIQAVGKDNIAGVYAANDGTAGGAVAAMKSAGFSSIPPLTGQDADLAGIQRIVAGQQYMTVYKAIKPEAEAAAKLAVALLKDEKPTDVNGSVDNGSGSKIPSVLLTPVAVTQENIAATVVKDGFYSTDKICTSAYAAACRSIGLTK